MFDRTVCLLLDKRFDQKKRISEEMLGRGIATNFFLVGGGYLEGEAYGHIDVQPPVRFGYPPWVLRPNSYNASLSFRKIVAQAKADGIETLLLLEDDATPTADFSEIFSLAWDELPEWDMFYLGANHTFFPTKQVSQHLLRVNGSGCWHAVALKKTVFDDILALPMDGPIDGMCAKYIHPKRACYACWPNIMVTVPGYSHCEGRDVDYSPYFLVKGC